MLHRSLANVDPISKSSGVPFSVCCLQFSRRFNSPPGSVHGEEREKQRRTWLSVRPSPISSLRETHFQREKSQHQITRTCTSLYLHRAGQWLNSTCSLNGFLKRLESEGRALSSRGLFKKVPISEISCVVPIIPSRHRRIHTPTHSHTSVRVRKDRSI